MLSSSNRKRNLTISRIGCYTTQPPNLIGLKTINYS